MIKNLVFNGFSVLIVSISSAGGIILFTLCSIFRCPMVFCVDCINPQILGKILAGIVFFKLAF